LLLFRGRRTVRLGLRRESHVYRFMPEITDLLHAAQAGQELASRRLFELVYGELRRMAHHRLLAHRPNGEIDTTSLAHETYVRLAEHGPLELPDRRSFYATSRAPCAAC
jgi:hypothetical protein